VLAFEKKSPGTELEGREQLFKHPGKNVPKGTKRGWQSEGPVCVPVSSVKRRGGVLQERRSERNGPHGLDYGQERHHSDPFSKLALFSQCYPRDLEACTEGDHGENKSNQ
jgi:hypothetical protein